MVTSRRSALLTLTAIIGAMLRERLDAQSTFTGRLTQPDLPALAFDLRAFKMYQITLDGKPVISLTPEQMADALREKG